MTPRLRFALPLLALTVTGCATVAHVPPPQKSREQVLLEEHDRYFADLRREQAKLAWENTGPRFLDFPDGTVIVREWRLLGLPGEEYLSVFFTYDNSTFRTFDRARVWCTIHAPGGPVVSSRWVDLTMPWYDFAPGNTYTMEMRIPTRGIHWQRGWHWSMGCSAHERVVTPEPLPPPVLVGGRAPQFAGSAAK